MRAWPRAMRGLMSMETQACDGYAWTWHMVACVHAVGFLWDINSYAHKQWAGSNDIDPS